MQDNKTSIRKYIILLVVLLGLYYVVSSGLLDRDRRKSRDELVSENIIKLEKSSNELNSLVEDDKAAINDLFFNTETSEKIRGLLNTYPTDRELAINDNIKIILQQNDNPVKIRYKRAEFELVNSRFSQTDDSKDSMTAVNDVKVIENPNKINDFELIHDLKTYLVDAYGQNALNMFLDEIIEDTIKENDKLIKAITSKNN